MIYKKGDRYKCNCNKWYIYEYVGEGKRVRIVQSYDSSDDYEIYSFHHGSDEYLGNFTKSDNFNNLFEILKG